MEAAIRLLLIAISTSVQVRGHEDLAEYIRLASSLVREGSDAAEELAALTAEIQEMANTGTNPSAEQWERVRARRRELAALFDVQRDGGAEDTA